MSIPVIRAALEAAEREPTTAGKIAAFLRVLPDCNLRAEENFRTVYAIRVPVDAWGQLARAVEEAAGKDASA